MLVLVWVLAPLLVPLPAAAQQARPCAELQHALQESARVVCRQGQALLRAAQSGAPEAASLRRQGLRVIEQAERMKAVADGLSVQVEQAARSVRQECTELLSLAQEMQNRDGRHPEVARRLMIESERLRRSASRTPAAVLPEPFEGLATGVSRI